MFAQHSSNSSKFDELEIISLSLSEFKKYIADTDELPNPNRSIWFCEGDRIIHVNLDTYVRKVQAFLKSKTSMSDNQISQIVSYFAYKTCEELEPHAYTLFYASTKEGQTAYTAAICLNNGDSYKAEPKDEGFDVSDLPDNYSTSINFDVFNKRGAFNNVECSPSLTNFINLTINDIEAFKLSI